MNDTTVKPCNGWSSKETYLVNLWMENDEISYRYLNYIKKRGNSKEAQAIELSAYIEELLEDSTTNLFKYLMMEVLSRVDWLEIVSSQ